MNARTSSAVGFLASVKAVTAVADVTATLSVTSCSSAASIAATRVVRASAAVLRALSPSSEAFFAAAISAASLAVLLLSYKNPPRDIF